MRNIHIYPSPMTNETRILKETKTLIKNTEINEIFLVGTCKKGTKSTEEVEPGITIHRLGPSKGKGLMKILIYPIWLLHVFCFCFKRKPNIVNCHSLWVLPVGVLLKCLTNCRLVYDAHELETETVGMTTQTRVIARCVEKFCMSWVDLLIVVTPGIENWYRQHYKNNAVITILNVPHYKEMIKSNRLADTLGLDRNSKIVLYQGMLGAHRGVELMLESAPLLKSAGYDVVFMGDGRLAEKIRIHADQGMCHLLPAVNPGVLLEYTSSAHVGLLLLEGSCLSYRLSLGNKIFEYLMAGLPVLVSNLPEMRNLLNGKGVGIFLSERTPEAVLAALQAIQKMREENIIENIHVFNQSYNWQQQEAIMLKAYKKYVFNHECN